MSPRGASTRNLVGSRELKTRLGRYLRAVRGGATLTITERGVPVARLVPLSPEEREIDAVLDELEARGVLSKGTGEDLDEHSPAAARGEPIERTIARERDERL